MAVIGTHNWIAIFVLALAWTLFAYIWYSPKLFGSIWADKHDLNKEASKKNSTPAGKILATFLNCLLGAFALSFFDRMTGSHTIGEGALNGFIAWLGFVVPCYYGYVLWENESWEAFSVHTIFKLISLVVFGAILAIW